MMLGLAFLGQKKYGEAEPLLQSAYPELMQVAGKSYWPFKYYQKRFITESLGLLIQLYDRPAQKGKADVWRKELSQAKANWKKTTP